MIRNHRQVSLVAAEELAIVAEAMGLPELAPGLIADNICTEGIPDLTALPRMTRLVFDGGAVLMLGGENMPVHHRRQARRGRPRHPAAGLPEGGHRPPRRDGLGRAPRASCAPARAYASSRPDPGRPSRLRAMAGRIRTTLSSLAQNWSMTQKVYKLLPLEVGGIFLATFVVVFVPVYLWLNWLTALILALPAGLLAATFWFSRRAMRAAYTQIDGQPGAAAAVIQSLRGGNWLVTPAVAVNKSQDMITRVVGKPGVVLVSEGPSSRVVPLLATERKRTARWLPEVPIYEIQVGNDEGQVPLKNLQKALGKLPRNMRGGEVTEIRRRLDALGNAASSMPIPKGPMPTSARQVRRQR